MQIRYALPGLDWSDEGGIERFATNYIHYEGSIPSKSTNDQLTTYHGSITSVYKTPKFAFIWADKSADIVQIKLHAKDGLVFMTTNIDGSVVSNAIIQSLEYTVSGMEAMDDVFVET